ncbi:DUF4837 family protein [uncultured Bacteroides sp.]|uniref:DUF4837 family protein n=1 Tax=uncultured Bacteroides sp. TaxID=162156 RepID=UPI0023CB2BEA|nr:DUF4837 family protein [uncultured Bacteroides sp.]MDE6172352.1 DUF4837 family protein [Bacteroides sp.]
MKKQLFFLSLAFMTLVFSACSGGKKGVFGATSSGRAYEILVVVDPGMWERPAGRALFDVLDTDVPGLPQSERSFRMMYTAPANYDATLKLIRNIIIADVQDIYTHPKFKYAKDVYAAPQTILTIQAPDEASFETFVSENKQVIIDFFTRAEMNRQIVMLEKKHNDYVATKVKSMFDCDVWVPVELSSTKQGEDFFWAGMNAATADQNFVIYSFPYTDKNTFTKEYFVQKRDSFMKANIPGAQEGMYMMTDSLMTDVRPLTIQGEYALEARGLWRMKGDFMGGPYVSHMRLDQVNQRIIVVEAFIYSPDKMKRNLMRQMEASLYTLRLPGDKRTEAEIPLSATKEQVAEEE